MRVLLRIKSRIHFPDFDDAANHQTRSREQDDGKGQFNDNEHSLNAVPRTG